MDCLFNFASSSAGDLVIVALNQLRYPCCFNKFVKKLEQEERDLIVTRDSVQKFVSHTKRQTRETSEIVDKWLQDAISDVDNVNQLLNEARKRKICCFKHCPNWIWRYRVGKKLANKTVNLQKLIERGRKYAPLDRNTSLPSGTLDILSEKYMNFESRQSAYEEVLEAVKNDDVSMIGLYGMGGCGKTTLAMEVRKVVEAEHLFDKVLFVPISSTMEVRRIQEKIASSLQFEFSEPEEKERAQRLCSRLTIEKKILLILDDAWEKLMFGRIGIPSSEHHKGCKILITTRSKDVCTSMNCQRKIYLPILTNEEAWNLFQNKALISKDSSDTLKHLGRLISNECKGLPVAIAAVASSLKGKVETIWSVALNKLKSSKPINIERGLIDPYKCLQCSYDNLDTEEAKSLFLLCSVFPEDFEIPIQLLTRCAIGLGAVGEAQSYEEARSEVIAAKIKLVSSCLLLDEENECVKMHDIIRVVAHLIAKNENNIIKCELEKDVALEQNSVRYLWCAKFPNDLDSSNLEFLYLKTKPEDFNGIFKRMGMLKVLVLVNDGDGIRPLLKMPLKTLPNLRYLHIDGYELSDFSFVSDMKKLQSLSLRCCSLPLLPELQMDVAITQHTTLKLLELNKCDIKGKKFEVIKRSPLLEELYIIDIKGEWHAKSEDNIEFFNTFSVPQTLQRYEIALGSHNFCDYNGEKFCSNHKTLLLNYFDISNEVIKSLANKANNLFVANIMGGPKSIIPDIFQIKGGGLNELIKFEIRDSEEIECLIDTSKHMRKVLTIFSKLHTLRMENMKNLRALWLCFSPSNGPFENLVKLYLRNCPQLTSLFTYVVARSLVQLKILKIVRCDGLKYILAYDDKTEKLTTGHPLQIFQSLEEVEVYSCRELKHIFSASVVGGLGQLKVLKIENCDMLDQIFGDIVPSTDHDKKEELDEIIEEGKHPHLYTTSIPSTTIVNHSPGTLASFASLRIKNCPKLSSIFTTSIAKTLTSLEELFIEYCHGLKHIIETDDEYGKENLIAIFPNLRQLSVGYCDQLKYMFGQNPVANQDCREIHIHFSSLEMLSLNDLPNFVSICATNTLTVTWPSLKDFQCHGCSYPFFDFVSCLTSPVDSGEPISTTRKDPKGIQNHFPTLQTLTVNNCEVKGIFCLIGYQMIEEQVSLSLEHLLLQNLPQMTDIWVASKNSIILQQLTTLEIIGCGKLEVIFPKSLVRCLPELKFLAIGACEELRQIIEEDKTFSNILSTQPCFPKLEKLSVKYCDKLKRLSSSSNDLPNLKILSINGASELEEIIGCEQGASSNSFTFPNLTTLEITGCGKLKVIFPKSLSRCLPELIILKIRFCKELRQIIEEDVEDKALSNLSPQPCFPKLEALCIERCHKLKTLFIGSASNDLPNLHALIINGAFELEELVGCGQGKGEEIGKTKVELSRLKLLMFMHLSSFRQETELPDLKNCIVYECPKLSLASTTTFENIRRKFPHKDFQKIKLRSWDIRELICDLEVVKTKSLSSGIEDISIGGGVATHIESSGVDILAQHSKVVEQDDKMNAGKVGIVSSQGIEEEGLNLLDKQEGIDILSNNNIDISPDIRTRLGAYKHFVDLDDAQITLLVEAITAYPHLWNACGKFSERFQAWRLKILADMLLFLQKESVDSVIPQREQDFHKLCEEAVEVGFESSWVDQMRELVVARDPKLREDIAQGQMDENPKSSVDMELDSQAVEQGDWPNENCKRTSICLRTRNANSSLEEGSNLVDKEGEIGVVSNDDIVAPRNEEPEKELVAKVSTSEIPRITTSLSNSQPVERPTPIYLNIPLHETPSNTLVDKQRISETCMLNQQKPIAEIVISPEIPQSIEQEAVEETIAKNTNMVASSIHSESASLQLDQVDTSHSRSHPHNEIRSSQTETRTAKASEGHPKIIQDLGANDIVSLFAPVVLGKEGEDNRVAKTLVELQKYLKMSLKDIVSSETNSLCLLSALNFLSNLPFKDITLSDGLKDIIDIMHQEFASILCSFKQGFATTDKLAVLEARQNEVAITLASKISEVENSYNEAQVKEVVLKEQIIRLKEEIKVCETALSSLEEEKNNCIAETIGYKMELENVRKEKSQMVEDQRKVQQELLEVTYKWSVLCSQYEHNRMATGNPS